MTIKIDLKIFLFLAIFIITRQIEIYALLMIFALIHELGHFFMGLFLGFKPEALSIIPTGFSISFKAECINYNVKIKQGNLLAIKQILIALAGPLTNIILIIILFIYNMITQNQTLLNIPLDLMIYANILIFIFNMIPIYPLDGGRILKNITYIFLGLKSSYIITNKISNIIIIILTALASVFVLMYKNIAIILIIIYLWIIIIRENRRFNSKIKIINLISQKNIEKNVNS